MNELNITTPELARCLSLLEKSRDHTLTAAQIAFMLQLAGNRETQRRHVRALIKELRDNGSHIIATLWGGYLLTDDSALWRDYIEGRQIDAKRILAVTHRRKKIINEGKNQGMLFDNRVRCGVATCGGGLR